jgi:hypothetical protein
MTEWKFKVRAIPQIPMDAYEVEVPDYRTGKIVERALAGYDLFQYDNNVKGDYSNALGVCVLHPTETENEWWDIEPDEAHEHGWISDQELAEIEG